MSLKPSLSSYLDLLRFTAALAVLLAHMDLLGLGMGRNPLAYFSHEAVMIFFVLSGFIIHYSTNARSASWQQYAVARLSRIYSVVMPVVVACVAIAWWLSTEPWLDPQELSDFSPISWWHTVSTLLFLNQSWMNQATLTLNAPYWSLSYEVWFYVMFGAWYFVRGRTRWLLLGAAGTVAGPAILLLLPVWLMGAWLAASGRYAVSLSVGWAWVCFTGPLLLIVLMKLNGIDSLVKTALHDNVPGFWRLMYSQRFVTDYVIGAAVCVHIMAFSSLPQAVQSLFARYQKQLAALAAFSFTLYLFHWPMIQLLGAYFPISQGEVLLSTLVALAILLACWLISWVTERQLPIWRRAFSRLLLPGQPKSAP